MSVSVLRDGGYYEYRAIVRTWEESGVIDRASSRANNRVRIAGTRARVISFSRMTWEGELPEEDNGKQMLLAQGADDDAELFKV